MESRQGDPLPRRIVSLAYTPAVRHGRVVPIPEAWLGRPGPRLVEGAWALRRVVDDARMRSD